MIHVCRNEVPTVWPCRMTISFAPEEQGHSTPWGDLWTLPSFLAIVNSSRAGHGVLRQVAEAGSEAHHADITMVQADPQRPHFRWPYVRLLASQHRQTHIRPANRLGFIPWSIGFYTLVDSVFDLGRFGLPQRSQSKFHPALVAAKSRLREVWECLRNRDPGARRKSIRKPLRSPTPQEGNQG